MFSWSFDKRRAFLRLFWLFLFILLFVILVTSSVPSQAASTTLVISEVMYDPTTAEPANEWIEVYNLSASTIDLTNYKIGDEETSGGGEGMFLFPAGSTIAPNQVIIIANQAPAFNTAYGFNPDYELLASDPAVPDMSRYNAWAGGNVGLSNSGDEVLLLDPSDTLVDSLSWGSSNWAFNPDAPDVSADHTLERDPADVDTDTAADWVDQATPDPGNVNGGATPTDTPTSPPPTVTPTVTNTPPAGCGKTSSYTAVWEIQGNGHTSPLDGTTVNNVRGIVTADFQAGTGGPQEPRGFFIQAHETDCDPATSDGILVYASSTIHNINVGDLVEIDNSSVSEYQGFSAFIWELTVTELVCTSACTVTTLQSNYGLPAPEEYDPPADELSALAYNEAREGMLMQVTVDTTVIAPINAFNEFVVVRGANQDRLHHDSTDDGRAIMVDGDGVASANCGADGFGYIKTFDAVGYNPAGNSVIYGPLNYNFNFYKIQQDDDTYCISHTPGDDSSYDPADNPAPAGDTNTLTIASLNAWNFFDTNDDPNKSDPIPTTTEYDRKSLKRANAICDANGLNRPHIIGLQEVENDTVLQKLVNDIATICGETYNYHTLAAPDNRSIEVAYLTRADVVTVLDFNDRQGCSATDWSISYQPGDHPPDITCSGATPHYLFNRPPLHLEAQITLAGSTQTLHIFANHFKSKLPSASCAITDCTDRRVAQAQHVDTLVDDLLLSDPNANIIVMGDLNDYYNSDPLDVLDQTNGVLYNVWADLAGPPSTGQGTIARYSYIHNASSQTLDHLLVSSALNQLSRTVSPRHLNVDWPGSHVDDNTMFRASDHDFLLVAFDFASGTPPTPTPTNTPVPPTATPTPTATNTPTPTATNTPTPTPTNTPTPTPTPTSGDILYLSSTSGGNAGGVSFADEDILEYDLTTGTWAMYFDGSDVGLGGNSSADVDAFTFLNDDTILLSFSGAPNITGVGTVDDSDIVQFTPTSLGTTTAGTFSLFFDGSDVGLATNSEDIDAIGVAPDGRLIISTIGAHNALGVAGSDEDFLIFTATSFGDNTSGTWETYFDGSDVDLGGVSTEDIYGGWVDSLTNNIYLTARDAYSVPGVSGDRDDIFICTPGSLGVNTTCTYSLFWDGDLFGFGNEIIDGLFILR